MSCIYSLYRISEKTSNDIGAYICDCFDAIIASLLFVAINKKVAHQNVLYKISSIVGTFEFFLFLIIRVNAFIPLKMKIFQILGDDSIDIARHFPLGGLSFYGIFFCDYYIKYLIDQYMEALHKICSLQEKIDKPGSGSNNNDSVHSSGTDISKKQK
jgi:hypothetical protein